MPSGVIVAPATAWRTSGLERGPSSGHRVEPEPLGGVAKDRLAERVRVLIEAMHGASVPGRRPVAPTAAWPGRAPSILWPPCPLPDR